MSTISPSASYVTVQLGDGLNGMRTVRNEAALLLSDLPSGETAADFDVRVDLAAFWPAAWQAVRSDGVVVVMCSSLRFAFDVYDSQRDSYRYDLVWNKSLATGFLNARTRPLRAHEFVLVFWRGGRSTYRPQMAHGHEPMAFNGRAPKGQAGGNYGEIANTPSRAGATDRYPTSVLRIASVGNQDPKRVHPQQKPDALMANLVLTYSLPGDLVIDPFAGSGTTGRASIVHGRRFLGWDNDPRFGKP